MTWSLTFTRPDDERLRLDWLYPHQLALLTDGRVSEGRLGGRMGNPEYLALAQRRANEELTFAVVGRRQFSEITAPEWPMLDGVKLERGTLAGGASLTWHSVRIEVAAITLPLREERAMIAAAVSDEAARQIYADWLEAAGHLQRAEWARTARAPTAEGRARLRALTKELGAAFRAQVSQGPIERCNQSCVQRWETLTLGERPWVRRCGRCQRDVSYCGELSDAHRVGGPVMVDPSIERREGDLMPPPMIVG